MMTSSRSKVQDAVTRILVPLFKVGAFDRKIPGDPAANVATPAHAALSENFAAQTVVLLKNAGGALPLDVKKMKRGFKIGVVGDADNVKGGGSGSVWSGHIVSPTEGILDFLAKTRTKDWALQSPQPAADATGRNVGDELHPMPAKAAALAPAPADACAGCKCNNCTVGIDYNGNDLHYVNASTANACCDACTGTAGCNAWSWNGPNSLQCWLKTSPLGGYSKVAYTVSGIVNGWTPPAPPPPVQCSTNVGPMGATVCNHSIAYKNCGMGQCNQSMCTTVVTEADIAASVAVAKQSDVVIVNVAVTMTEGYDRDNLGLGPMQDKLVEAVVATNPNTIVVVRCPGAVLMPWADKVKAVVVQFLPGQASGTALASVLFGETNPSGKLPISFPAHETQHWLTKPEQYPGVLNASENGQYIASYTEGLEIGYRWYDAQDEAPAYEFGAGKSYTTFSYSDLAVDASKSTLTFTLKNSGTVAGAEVPQLYLGYPAGAGEPPKVLRNFTKVFLAPGYSQTVTFPMLDTDRRVWDVPTDGWKKISGSFTYMIGSSSRDIRLAKAVTMA